MGETALPNHLIWLAGFSFGGYIAAKCRRSRKNSAIGYYCPAIRQHDFQQLQLSIVLG